MSYFNTIWNLGRYNFLKEILKDTKRFDNVIYAYFQSDPIDIFKIKYSKLFFDLQADVAWNTVTPWFEIDGVYGDPNMTKENPNYYKSDISFMKTFILPYKDEWKKKLIESKIKKIEEAKASAGDNEDLKGDYKIWNEIKEKLKIPNDFQKTEENDKFLEKYRPYIFSFFASKSFNLSIPLTELIFNPAPAMIRERVASWMTENGKLFNIFTDNTTVKAGFNTTYLVSQLEKKGQYRGEEFGSIFDKDEEILKKLQMSYYKYNTIFGKVAIKYDLDINRIMYGSIGGTGLLLLTCCCCCLILMIMMR